MQATIHVPGLDCESCVKAVSRVVSRHSAQLVSADVSAQTISVTVPSEEALSGVKAALIDAGYGADDVPVARGSLRRPLSFFAGVLSDNPAFSVERSIAEATLASLFVMLALSILTLSFPGLSAARPFFPLLLLSSFGISACFFAFSHYRAFSQPLSCMSGMMAGMTIGMSTGFLTGAIVGAANGMLVGSVAGMAVGMAMGAWAGAPVGAMGVMEGLMAGLMAGTMGAMLSVMLVSDALLPFLVLLFAASIFILLGLSYLLFRESGSPDGRAAPGLIVSLASNTFIFLLLSALVVWGPRSSFVWRGS